MSFRRYDGYKDSGVEWLDEVPKHWRIASLRHGLAKIFNGLTVTQVDPGEGTVPVTRIETISAGVIDEKKLGYIPASEARGDRRLQVGDIVFSNINSLNMIGNCAVYLGGGTIYAGMNLLVLRPSNDVSHEWLAWVIRCPLFRQTVESLAKPAINQASISQGSLLSILIATPPLSEQSTIAAFLDRETAKIDALVEEQKRLIELLKEKRQAVISHAATKGLDPNAPMEDTGIEWLGEVPQHWEVRRVGYRYEVQLGRMLNEERAQGENMKPYLRVVDVQWNSINVHDLPQMDFPADAQARYRLRVGDLLVNEGGSYVGRSAIWHGELEECYYQKALHRLRPHDDSRDTAEFFLYVMEMATQLGVFVAGGNQTTIDHLTAEQLRSYRFAFPPLIEQCEIALHLRAQLARLQSLIGEAEAAIALLQERRTALISAAVTGKIDVRNQPRAERQVPKVAAA
jgi:type I restriction enzyme, S subunit